MTEIEFCTKCNKEVKTERVEIKWEQIKEQGRTIFKQVSEPQTVIVCAECGRILRKVFHD